MAVFKRITCSSCKGHIAQIAKDVNSLAGYECRKPGCLGRPQVSSKWYVSTYLLGTDGKTHKITKAVGTKKEAETYERKALEERENGAKKPDRKDHSLEAFYPVFDQWMEDRQKQGKLQSGSVKSYRMRMTAHLLPAMGRTDIRQIDTDMVDRYKSSRMEEVAPATVNRELATLKRCLTVAVSKKWIRFNPLQGYELLVEDNERDRYLSPEEVDRLLGACSDAKAPKHLHPIVSLGLHTGLRIEGVLTLKWEEVKWDQREIHKIVKGRKLVRIPMTQSLIDSLRTWQCRDGVIRALGFVFPSTKLAVEAPMLVTSNFGLASACKRAGIKDCTFHTLRHTFATRFLERWPEHMNTLMVIMGHTSDYMTRRYAHLTDKTRHEVMMDFKIGKES